MTKFILCPTLINPNCEENSAQKARSFRDAQNKFNIQQHLYQKVWKPGEFNDNINLGEHSLLSVYGHRVKHFASDYYIPLDSA